MSLVPYSPTPPATTDFERHLGSTRLVMAAEQPTLKGASGRARAVRDVESRALLPPSSQPEPAARAHGTDTHRTSRGTLLIEVFYALRHGRSPGGPFPPALECPHVRQRRARQAQPGGDLRVGPRHAPRALRPGCADAAAHRHTRRERRLRRS